MLERGEVSTVERARVIGRGTVTRRDAFVGREDVLCRLHAAFTDARAGRRRVVLLAGEPGIGKTRSRVPLR